MTFFADTFEETDIPDSPTICKESFELVARIVPTLATICPKEFAATPPPVFAASKAEFACMKAALAVFLAYWSVVPPPEPAFAVYCFEPSAN